MAQWINLHRNNIFINWMQLPLLCEKSGAILLVLVGLTAGRQAGSQGRFQKFKDFHDVLQRYSVIIVGHHVFLCRSLLLSTTVLIYIY